MDEIIATRLSLTRLVSAGVLDSTNDRDGLGSDEAIAALLLGILYEYRSEDALTKPARV